MEDDLLSLLQFINWNIEQGKYSERALKPVKEFIKRQIRKTFLEGEFE